MPRWLRWSTWVARVRAFTLLEVMIATVVLTAALFPVIGSFESAYRQHKKAREMTDDVYIAQCVFESVRYRLYDGDSRRCKLNDDPQKPTSPSPWDRFLDEIEDPGKTKTLDQVKVVQLNGSDCSKYFATFMRADA